MVTKIESVQELYKRDLLYEINYLKKAFDKVNINIYVLNLSKDVKVRDYIQEFLKYHVSSKKHDEFLLMDDFVKNAPIQKSINLTKKILKILGDFTKNEGNLEKFYEDNYLKERILSPIEKEHLNKILVQVFLQCDKIDTANRFLLESFSKGGDKL